MIAKRTLDILISLAGLVILLPLLLLVGVWIKVESAGPVLFRQERVGRYGRAFRIHKFRTMRVEAASSGLPLTVGADPRITRAGAFLRKYKIDELPQLLDVLIGSMSLVGPRPEVPKYVAHYPPSAKKLVLSVRPGITDNASIEFFEEGRLLAESPHPEKTYVEEILPKKLAAYEEYVRGHSLLGDLKIIARTVGRIANPRQSLF